MQAEKKFPIEPVVQDASRDAGRHAWALYLAAALAAFTAIAYELLLASYATFLLGASIFQYSLVLSAMMAAMGVGALVTRRLRWTPIESFLGVELCLATLAAVAIPVLYLVFSTRFPPHPVLLLFVTGIGMAIGMEIPLLNELCRREGGLTNILFFDYLGGFLGGVLFPLWLLPRLGFFRLGAGLAAVNAALALLLALLVRTSLGTRARAWIAVSAIALVASVANLAYAERIRRVMEWGLFHIYEVL